MREIKTNFVRVIHGADRKKVKAVSSAYLIGSSADHHFLHTYIHRRRNNLAY